MPALVNTSATGSLPATVTLYGDATYNDKYRSGEWTQGGMWFDCCHEHGIQGDFFFVGRESSPFFATSDGDPILTRPFIDANTGLPAGQLIAVPGVVVGSISVDNHNWLEGAAYRCAKICAAATIAVRAIVVANQIVSRTGANTIAAESTRCTVSATTALPTTWEFKST